ncbi:hypothetical protein BH10ACI4_BH10ACI4_38590 [soil metagenome]
MTSFATHEEASIKPRIRVAYLVSHPIQYQAPLLRRIAEEPDIALTVLFASDFSTRGYQDAGFGVGVEWGVPLLDGYDHEFLPHFRDLGRTGIATQINYGIFSRLRGTAASPGFDVLWMHGYSTVNAWQGMIWAKALGLPVLLRAESWTMSQGRSPLLLLLKSLFFKIVGGMVDATLPIGSRNAAYWTHYLGDKTPQFATPYAVDNAYFQQRSADAVAGRDELRKQIDLDPLRPVILFASKLQKRKCCSDLLAAYGKLCRSLENLPQPYLLIVGDGEEKTSLEAQAAASGLNGIRFCGFRNQTELPRYFDLASIFVLPSRQEPWGLVVNEAMNAGCAILVSDEVGCQPDLVTPGVEGDVFPAGDQDALADCLREMLRTPETVRRMGKAASMRIEDWNFEADVTGLRRALAQVTGKLEA